LLGELMKCLAFPLALSFLNCGKLARRSETGSIGSGLQIDLDPTANRQCCVL
jgi:hypothetical protein